MDKKPIGEILISSGLIEPGDLEEALRRQKRQLGEILVEMGKIRPEDVDSALTVQSVPVPRAARYLRYLRVTLVLLVVVGCAATGLLYQRLQSMRLRDALDGSRLPAARILEFLKQGSAGERLDALRSVARLERKDEKTFVLREALGDAHWTVRLVALMHIRAERLPVLVQDMIPHLMDADRTVRHETLRLLRELTGEDRGETFLSWYEWGKKQGMKILEPRDFADADFMKGP